MNEIGNRYRYELTDRFGVIEVVPLNECELQIEFEKEKDFKNFFVEKMKSKIVFVGEIYERLKLLEGSEFLFDVLNLRVWKLCNGIEQTVYSGEMYLTSGEWDKDKCVVTLEFEEQKPDKCIENRKKEKINLLAEIQNKVVVDVNTLGGGVYEYKTCDFANTPSGVGLINSQYGDLAWCGLGSPFLQNWKPFTHTQQKSQLITDDNGNPLYVHKTVWIRELVTISCNEPAQSDWVLIQNDCGTNNTVKYAKKAFLTNENFTHSYTSADEFLYYYTSSIFAGVNSDIGKIDNGMLLKDVIIKFISKFCPSMVVVSDFFQINPENPSAINYVTNETNLVEHLVLFQKSDVKRPAVTGNATKAEWTFEKLIETLNLLFSVKYEIYDNVFRLEHQSWFGRNQGLDLTLPKYAKWVKAKNKYTYDFESIPRKEIFGFKEFSSQQWNAEIVYTGDMARGKVEEDNSVIEELTTDVQLCFDNPSSDSNKVDDNGFVLVATRKSGNSYNIITESLEEIRINNSLSFPQLIKRYGLHDRYADKGKLNGSPIIFKSVKPIKKGEELVIPYCCDDVFEPNDIVKTELGNGIVESATLKLSDNTLRLKLAYDVFTTMIPLIDFEGGTFTVEKNKFIVIPLFATMNIGSIVSYTILSSFNMVNTLQTPTSMKVKPNFGFVGTDTVSVIAVSDIPNVTKQVVFTIHVVDSTTGIVAHNDTYNVFHGLPFAPTSILANDASLDGIMTIVTPNIMTDAGVSVTIENDGTFLYSPPYMFMGVDFFSYTIEDGNGNQSTATVFLNVTYANLPIGVDDYFQTGKNTTLITNGDIGLQRVTDNDYTPDGQVYTYSTVGDTFLTMNGGNVVMHDNGLFEYSAPANFVGQDHFDYTVLTSGGSGVGRVYVQVLPEIYVSFEKIDEFDEIVQQNCNGTMVGDIVKKCKYIAYFWSDVNGTVPFDVTGLNLRLKYMVERVIGTIYQTEDKMTDIMAGTSDFIVVDFIFEKKIDICKPYLGNETAAILLYEHGYNLI